MDVDKLLVGYGDRIRERRKLLGLTLDKVAERAGIAKSYVWEIENGKNKNPTIRTAYGLCHALGWTLADLIGVSEHAEVLHPVALKVALDVDAALRAQKKGEIE